MNENVEDLNEDTLQEEVTLGKPAVDVAKDATGATNDHLNRAFYPESFCIKKAATWKLLYFWDSAPLPPAL